MKRWIAILIVGGAGCSSISTSTDYDPKADFSRLKTFDWLPGRPPPSDSLTAARVERAVEDGLRSRGYTRMTTTRPDFHVVYQVWAGQRVESVPSSTYSYGWRSGYAVGTEVRTYDEGTLVLDVVDSVGRTLLWRGVARAAIDPSRTPQEREAMIREAVEKLLAEFPPGGKHRPEPPPAY